MFEMTLNVLIFYCPIIFSHNKIRAQGEINFVHVRI